jgi:alcohol dehydrogenase class IV
MIEASLASGISLANSGLGAVHGFASGIGGMFDMPHGLICAVLLPGICKLNSDKKPDVYEELAKIINSGESGNTGRLVNRLYELNKKLEIPDNFKEYSIPKDFAEEIAASSKGSSMSGNPVEISDEEWADFIKEYL